MLRKFHNIVYNFSLAKIKKISWLSGVFIINADFILKYLYGRIHLTVLLDYQAGNLTTRGLEKWIPLRSRRNKKNREGSLFLPETHPRHSKHIPTTISNVYLHQQSHQTDLNQFNLCGAIASLMFNFSCIGHHYIIYRSSISIVTGHMENIVILIDLPSISRGFRIIYKKYSKYKTLMQ